MTVTNTAGTIVSGDPFSLSYLASSLSVGSTYYLKAFGGVEPATNQVYTVYSGQNLSSTAAWASFPSFVIDAGGSASGTLSALIPSASGTVSLKLRLALTTNTDTQVTSASTTITVLTPTTTPVPTTVPTNTPLPTNTPTPTPVPSSTITPSPTTPPTRTPTPTLSPTPTIEPTAVIEPTPADYPTPTDSATVSTPAPTSGQASASHSLNPGLISIIFIGFGCSLLFFPLILIKIKH